MTRLYPRTSATEYLAELEEQQRADEEQVRRVMHKKYVLVGPLERPGMFPSWRKAAPVLGIAAGSLAGLAYCAYFLWLPWIVAWVRRLP